MTQLTKIQEQVKQRLIEGLTKQGLNWFKPWNAGQANTSFMPINRATGREYNGINVLFLNSVMQASGYSYNEWLTYKQATELGGNVKKGSTATDVYLWSIFLLGSDGKIYKKQEDVPAGVDAEKKFSLKFYKVFNIAQCEGIEPRNAATPVQDDNTFNPVAEAEAIINGWANKPKIINNSEGRAYYSPSRDNVVMPMPTTFVDNDSYYKTLFHELVHSTGHESRLNRKAIAGGVSHFGNSAYSQEELVAESGAMMLTGIANLSPKDNETNSQAYINAWVKGVKETPAQAIVSALTQSAKAVDMIINNK